MCLDCTLRRLSGALRYIRRRSRRPHCFPALSQRSPNGVLFNAPAGFTASICRHTFVLQCERTALRACARQCRVLRVSTMKVAGRLFLLLRKQPLMRNFRICSPYCSLEVYSFLSSSGGQVVEVRHTNSSVRCRTTPFGIYAVLVTVSTPQSISSARYCAIIRFEPH